MSTDGECKHEIFPASSCDMCNPVSAVVYTTSSLIPDAEVDAWFVASFDGYGDWACSECGGVTEEGTEIGRLKDGTYVHRRHVESAPELRFER